MKFTPGRWAKVADFFWPRVCTLCGRPIAEAGRDHLCAPCEDSLEWIGTAMCPRCGADMSGECTECRGREFPFDRVVAVGRYEGRLRTLLTHFKFYRRPDLAHTLGDFLADRLRREGALAGIDAVVPVPTDWISRFLRKYHAAEVLAEIVAERAEIPIRKDLLRKPRWRRAQVGLDRPRRERNPVGAFRAAAKGAPGAVLLIDDVLTTGATVGDATRALKEAGVRRVVVGVIGR